MDVESDVSEKEASEEEQSKESSDPDEYDDDYEPETKRKALTLPPERLLAFDHSRVTNGMAAKMLSTEYQKKVYKDTVKYQRQKARINESQRVLGQCQSMSRPLGVHFDGKSLADINDKKGKKFERLVVLLSGKTVKINLLL